MTKRSMPYALNFQRAARFVVNLLTSDPSHACLYGRTGKILPLYLRTGGLIIGDAANFRCPQSRYRIQAHVTSRDQAAFVRQVSKLTPDARRISTALTCSLTRCGSATMGDLGG